MGVLTHLDFYKENKQLRKAKKKLKKRFEYEVGGNYKLFHVSKLDNGVYPKIETAKIARYLGTSNPSTIYWRINHPYVLTDRW
jgi:ribosome biogenesis protein BMS1